MDYITPNEDEARYYSGKDSPEEMADVFLGFGAKNVVIKLGGKGCYFKNAETSIHLPACAVKAVDATGAGDNFAAGLACEILRGSSMTDALRFANACGGVSAAIGEALMVRRDLGCHSEMFTEPLAKLMQAGVINNSRKSFCPGKTVFTNALGSRAHYAYMDRNPALEARPCGWVNDPRVIARNDNMISVNGALCVDLAGQVCAESIGFRQFSGTGGQVDFVRGARWSKGGKSFLTLASQHVDKAGRRSSNISLTLPPGSIVTTPRADVHCIVTEYGVADLMDEPVDIRAKRLIAIAHPDFRDQLLFDAKKAGYII